MRDTASPSPLVCIVRYRKATRCQCVCASFAGEGVVPEQENEVEACEGRPAGGRSPREGTGEREERSAAAF